jgi:hypothetical protein
MTTSATPPGWAESLLRIFLKRDDVESVSGDLLEEYRESAYPSRGSRGASLWYVRQVFGFVWRSAGLWALLFAAAVIIRTAMDWRVPATDFHARSAVSTILGVGIFLLAGFFAALRSGSYATGPLAGMATAVIALPLQLAAMATLLMIWRDPMTAAAINGSGGLAEALTLPFVMIVPAIMLGAVGGSFGAACNRFIRR